MRGLLVPPPLALMVATAAVAQAPSAAWKTISTPHFRVHYTAPAEAWTLHAASLLESVRARVVAEVGYDPSEVTDVLVADPFAEPNGMALPLLGSPRMVLWTSPPGPASVIATYNDWPELLALHEDTHLVHTLRPSRNATRRLLEEIMPLGPIALHAPRWVIEGYATSVEGVLTGSGRPNSDFRAAILRQRARAGMLPTYGELSSDSRSWLGMSMAYLAGSAYLEWLEGRAGPDSLRKLWARMTARANRSFDAAFEGVFGEPPARLYDRFTAELTWRAVEAERILAPVEREGHVWQALTWSTGDPAVSPDGSRIAIVLHARERPPRLVVWSTGADESAEKNWREGIEKTLAKDPEDVAPVRSKPLPREPLHELATRDGAAPLSPRFLPGGTQILFGRFETDGNGFLHPDLFRWTPADGGIERLTRLADVREADPFPDGMTAVAVRYRDGFSQLVRVDLATGTVSAITEPSVEVVCSQPRTSPDGTKIAYVRHHAHRWDLVVREVSGGTERVLQTPEDSTVAYPAWGAGGQVIYASVGRDGFIDIEAFPMDGGAPRPVTRTVGAALAPAPTGTGVYFLGLQADGLDLRHIEVAEEPPAARPAALTAALAPAVRPAPPSSPPGGSAAPVIPGRPYGLGHQELTALVGGRFAPSSHGWELGARLGDVVGRLDALAVGAGGDAGSPRGWAAAVAWRGLPIALSLNLFDYREEPSRQPLEVPGLGERLDQVLRGGELRASWEQRWLAGGLEAVGGVQVGRVEPAGVGEESRRIVFGRALVVHAPSQGVWRFPLWAELRVAGGSTGDHAWRRFGGTVAAGVSRKRTGLQVSWQRDTVRDAALDLDRIQVGGVASTLLPEPVVSGRVLVPALPAGSLIGAEHEGQKATLQLGGLPVFYERHRVWEEGGQRGEWLRVAGAEWDLASDPLPIVKLPGVRLEVGVGRILDPPFEGRTEAWFSLAWQP